MEGEKHPQAFTGLIGLIVISNRAVIHVALG